MKTIKNTNTFAIALPFILGLIGLMDNDFYFWALLSTIITGIIQVILGLKLLIDEPKNKYLRIYIVLILIFFLTWYINSINGYNDFVSYFLIGFPPLLAIYLSVIIYKKQ